MEKIQKPSVMMAGPGALMQSSVSGVAQ
jgi:hypothetical protein